MMRQSCVMVQLAGSHIRNLYFVPSFELAGHGKHWYHKNLTAGSKKQCITAGCVRYGNWETVYFSWTTRS